MSGGRPQTIAAPDDLVGDWDADITQGSPRPELLTVDEVRSDPSIADRMVA
jgi:hypothetical protein